MKINKTICDQCGKEREIQQIGGWPMIQVPICESIGRATKDFCDDSCLLKYLEARKPKS